MIKPLVSLVMFECVVFEAESTVGSSIDIVERVAGLSESQSGSLYQRS